MIFFFTDPATTEIYTLSLHDALPICLRPRHGTRGGDRRVPRRRPVARDQVVDTPVDEGARTLDPAHHEPRSEEHTSELQSRRDLVCRLLLEKKKKKDITQPRGGNART